MTKRIGFTLIEVMIVIVILGILTAVAVPKFFGIIAKAKASEVPVAAGTYAHMQNAFLHENNTISSWKDIGYTPPGNGKTENFEYTGCVQGPIAIKEGDDDIVGWNATNISKLNYCMSRNTWSVVMVPIGAHDLKYRHMVTSEPCATLTANWEVGTTDAGACAASGKRHESKDEEGSKDDPEDPGDPEEPMDTPEPSASPEGSGDNEKNSQNNVDCDALQKSYGNKQNQGKKNGWVLVQECNLYVPPGQAPIPKDEQVKKKDVSSASSSPSSSTSNNSAASSGNTGSSSNSNSNNNTGSGVNGGGGGGGGGGGTPAQDTPADEPNQESGDIGQNPTETPTHVIYGPDNQPLDYNSVPDEVCTEYAGKSGNCKKTVSKDNCITYNAAKKLCTKTAD